MLQEAKNAGHIIKTILSDNGGEFDNAVVYNILQKYGIKHRLTIPYTPEQNGCSERENRTLAEAARSIMYARREMPQILWAELINTAAYALNRTGPTRVEHKVPYELWHGKKPKISHLRIIECECYAHILKQKRKKMSKKAIKRILIGYVEFKITASFPSCSEGETEINADNENVPVPESHEHVLEGDRTGDIEDQVQEEDSTVRVEVEANNDGEDEFVDADE